MKNSLIIILLLSTLGFIACEDEQPLPICETNTTSCDYQIDFSSIQDTCIDIIWGNGGIENIQTGSDTSFSHPAFSNSGTDMFYYIRTIKGPNISTLWQNDLCRGELILENEDIYVHFNDMDISNDWILYSNSSSQQLYKQKINGDSLTQLLPGQKCRNPVWLDEGEKILCYCRFESPTSFYNVILNSDGVVLDTMDIVTSNYDLLENNVAAISYASGEKEIGFLSMDSNSFQPIISSDEQFTHDMAWLDADHIIWVDPLGIHKVGSD